MTTTTLQHFCTCGGQLRVFDTCGSSKTAACTRCKCCWLLIERRDFAATVALADFHLKRGEGPNRRPLDDVTMATNLVDDLIRDQWPSMATAMDFGIDSGRHLAALQYAVGAGVMAYDLDRVIGDGPAITRLVRSIPGQPYDDVVFQTPYDDVDWEEECDDTY